MSKQTGDADKILGQMDMQALFERNSSKSTEGQPH